MSKRHLDTSNRLFQHVVGLQRDRSAFDADPDVESKKKLARWQSHSSMKSMTAVVSTQMGGTHRLEGAASTERSATASPAVASSKPPARRRGGSRAWSLVREVLVEPGAQRCMVRPLTEADVPALREFGVRGLSESSRALFAPYDWAGSSLSAQLEQAARHSLEQRDLHLVALIGDEIVAYGFLWSMADEVPELGLAVVDAYQRKGLGRALLLLLCQIARAESRWGVELTTMQQNVAALGMYENAGFERLGVIRNPLGCDVTAAFKGEVTPASFADEFHLVRVLSPTRRAEVLSRLEAKRLRASALFGCPGSA